MDCDSTYVGGKKLVFKRKKPTPLQFMTDDDGDDIHNYDQHQCPTTTTTTTTTTTATRESVLEALQRQSLAMMATTAENGQDEWTYGLPNNDDSVYYYRLNQLHNQIGEEERRNQGKQQQQPLLKSEKEMTD
jgi:hypothetical protein